MERGLKIDPADSRMLGVKLPFHIVTTWTDGRSDVVVTSAETNAAIDSSKFNQPPPSAPPQK